MDFGAVGESAWSNSSKRKLAKSVTVNVLAAMASLLSGLVVFPVYTTILGAERFGLVLVSLAIVGIAATADLGYSQMIIRRSAQVGPIRAQNDPFIRRSAVRLHYVGIGLSIGLILYGYLSHLREYGGWGAVLVLAIAGGLVPVGLRAAQSQSEGQLSFAIPRALVVLASILRIVTALLIGYVPDEQRLSVVIAAEASWLWLPAIGCLVVRNLRRSARTSDDAERTEWVTDGWTELRRFGLAASVSTSVGTAIWSIDLILVGWLFGPEEVIIFAAATRVVQVFRQVITCVLVPFASNMHMVELRGGLPALRDVWRHVHPAGVFGAAGVAAGSGVAGVVILQFLVEGPRDTETAQVVLMLLLASAVIGSAHQVGAEILSANRRPLSLLPAQATWVALRVTMVWTVCLLHGSIQTATLGILAVTVLVEPLFVYLFAKRMKLMFSVAVLRALIPAAITAIPIASASALATSASSRVHIMVALAVVASSSFALAAVLLRKGATDAVASAGTVTRAG
ncbi:oligosaccharide flippase family protein [Gordonia sp. zg691]|uniref:oligosaccharide flippase family protein n=1 Tax=Gordonia jinghuaiqii TaxID=2758710 RepID=UPI0016627C73|nr:oligosaccharide flippase family protein [Gordonia jinghuaiqii]MBD0864090.1 oligosaccharide flippase family protein [Gordonia jinghuaiqii]